MAKREALQFPANKSAAITKAGEWTMTRQGRINYLVKGSGLQLFIVSERAQNSRLLNANKSGSLTTKLRQMLMKTVEVSNVLVKTQNNICGQSILHNCDILSLLDE